MDGVGFYDVHADCLSGLFRRRKRIVETREALRRLRACYPPKCLFVIMDNLHNVHDHPRFLAVLRRLHMIYRYLRYRNRQAGQADHPLTRIRSTRPIKLDRP